jgi:glycosyltransferase involved in cell wall biosynthesis
LKKALIITYYWPPGGGAGVQRWLKFVKYMRACGWEPVVYTALGGEMPVIDLSLEKDVPPGIKVIRRPIWEPYTIYKKFIGRKKDDRINAAFLNEGRKTGLTEKISVWIRGNLFIPDARRFWIKPSIRYLKRWIQQNPVDVIISTGPPHSMHLIAMGLKNKFPQVKWVSDFRDPWTHIDFYGALMLSRMADKRHRDLEKEVLNKSDAVVSVGRSMSAQFREIIGAAGGDNSKFHVITNGYDADDVVTNGIVKDQKFTIAHVGTLVKDRNPETLWQVLARLVKTNAAFEAKLEIKLVGKVDMFVKESLQLYGLTRYVRQIAYMPHSEVIAEQQRSQVLLLLINRTANAQGILTGKFFEYMASGVPILAIGPEQGDLAAIIKDTGTGVICDFDAAGRIETAVLELFEGNTTKRNETAIAEYNRKNLTVKLCRLLDGLVRQ